MFLTSSGMDGYLQFITVLIVFVVVLGLTAFTTRYIANFQKQQNVNTNIEVLETMRITNNKYVQLIRIGDTYAAIAVCKDTVTMLCEIPKEQIKCKDIEASTSLHFKSLLNKALQKDSKK